MKAVINEYCNVYTLSAFMICPPLLSNIYLATGTNSLT